MGIPNEHLKSIAAILAAGYLRHREASRLACSATSSPHGHEVNGEFEGRIYKSLSAIAREATGTRWNGFLFFNLTTTEVASNGKG